MTVKNQIFTEPVGGAYKLMVVSEFLSRFVWRYSLVQLPLAHEHACEGLVNIVERLLEEAEDRTSAT